MRDRYDLRLGDCLEVVRTLDAMSVDAIVTDPPAGIGFMGKEWDHHKGGRDQWIAWMAEVAAECLRVAKPGAHALVWALPRTSHWTATAWEDAGWEVRDRVQHLFSTGFPKSLDVSKAIDREAGVEREVIGTKRGVTAAPETGRHDMPGKAVGVKQVPVNVDITTPATDAARQWEGWGTALKPAMEDWWLLRKPLTGTVAQNVLQYGVGGINIDGSRITDSSGSARSVGKEDTGRCPVHGLRSLRSTDAEMALPSGASEVADDLLASVSLTNDDRLTEPPVGWRAVGAATQRLPLHSDGPVAGERPSITTDSAAARRTGAQVSGGASDRPLARISRASTPSQWQQNGQPAGELALDGLGGTRERAQGDASQTDAIGSGEQTTPRCTCQVSGRWPAHLALSCWCDSERHDPECAVAMLDAQSGETSDPGASRYFFVARGEGATITAWNNATASDAQQSSRPLNQHVASAPSDAPIGAEPMADATPSPSTSGTPNESEMKGEHATPQIRNTGAKSSRASKPPRRIPTSSPVSDVEPSAPTDITTTTTSHSASAGSAGPVTSHTTQKYSERGALDSLRFRYTAKASRSEREAGVRGEVGWINTQAAVGSLGRNSPRAGAGRGSERRNLHPTVKPVELMRWLCRLITPPDGLVLDPFMGSGTTGMAALDEGFRFLGVEAETRYYEIAEDRITHRHLVEVETVEPQAEEPQGRLL